MRDAGSMLGHGAGAAGAGGEGKPGPLTLEDFDGHSDAGSETGNPKYVPYVPSLQNAVEGEFTYEQTNGKPRLGGVLYNALGTASTATYNWGRGWFPQATAAASAPAAAPIAPAGRVLRLRRTAYNGLSAAQQHYYRIDQQTRDAAKIQFLGLCIAFLSAGILSVDDKSVLNPNLVNIAYLGLAGSILLEAYYTLPQYTQSLPRILGWSSNAYAQELAKPMVDGSLEDVDHDVIDGGVLRSTVAAAHIQTQYANRVGHNAVMITARQGAVSTTSSAHADGFWSTLANVSSPLLLLLACSTDLLLGKSTVLDGVFDSGTEPGLPAAASFAGLLFLAQSIRATSAWWSGTQVAKNYYRAATAENTNAPEIAIENESQRTKGLIYAAVFVMGASVAAYGWNNSNAMIAVGLTVVSLPMNVLGDFLSHRNDIIRRSGEFEKMMDVKRLCGEPQPATKQERNKRGREKTQFAHDASLSQVGENNTKALQVLTIAVGFTAMAAYTTGLNVGFMVSGIVATGILLKTLSGHNKVRTGSAVSALQAVKAFEASTPVAAAAVAARGAFAVDMAAAPPPAPAPSAPALG
jgi:hypothetical protein